MKATLFIIFTLLSLSIFSQNTEFESLLNKGKAEFKKDFDAQDYKKAIEYLEAAVSLEPKNAEAHYFLGYAYSRLNSKDGRGMTQMSYALTLKTSQEFETVNALSKKYLGEVLVLDPYSKITGEWGSLAFSYLKNNHLDSALIAFKEGKKRGGFGDFFLEINRKVLSLCDQNAILMSSGDNFTIPLWYLQIVEGYRKDVSVIDINLLNTNWYPAFLSTKHKIQFDLPSSILDTIEYCDWHDSTFTVGNLTWVIRPTYYEHFLLRGDRVFMSLLKQNQFKRPLCFTVGHDDASALNLTNHLVKHYLIEKLEIEPTSGYDYSKFKTEIAKILSIIKKVNPNSSQEVEFIDALRYIVLEKISSEWNNKNLANAKELLKLMDSYIDEKEFPVLQENWKKYMDYLRSELK